jgi:hypothetical protein
MKAHSHCSLPHPKTFAVFLHHHQLTVSLKKSRTTPSRKRPRTSIFWIWGFSKERHDTDPPNRRDQNGTNILQPQGCHQRHELHLRGSMVVAGSCDIDGGALLERAHSAAVSSLESDDWLCCRLSVLRRQCVSCTEAMDHPETKEHALSLQMSAYCANLHPRLRLGQGVSQCPGVPQ